MKRLCLVVVLFALLITNSKLAMAGEPVGCQYKIVIDIPRYSLTLLCGEDIVKTYPIAIGKPSSPTPVGNFRIYNRAVNPTWHPNSPNPVPPGPNNPLGIRWLGFYRGYGIHGNNNPESVGKSISAGCIRMYNYDVAELYSMVGIGVPVESRYHLVEIKEDEGAVIAYHDIYKRMENYHQYITEQLVKLGIEDRIPQDKLDRLFGVLKKGAAVFTDKWVLKVNGHFFTADTLYRNGTVFVNFHKAANFFGLGSQVDPLNGVAVFKGKPLSIVEVDGRIYVSIIDITRVLGGELIVRGDIEEMDYRIHFVKLNGIFLTSQIEDIKVMPKIDISHVNPKKRGFMAVDRLAAEEGLRYEIFSKMGYIELSEGIQY